MGDYVPSSLDNIKPWLEGVKTGVTSDGPTCGQSSEQVSADIQLLDSILRPVGDALTKENAAIEARGSAETLLASKIPVVRAMLNRYKHATGWTEGMAESWKVSSPPRQYDWDTHSPDVMAFARPGMVVIRGRKPGFTSVTIQMRLEGTSEWIDIGVKLSRFPFMDVTAPQTPGKPEKREYRAVGYVGDEQKGQPSPIVTAVFGV